MPSLSVKDLDAGTTITFRSKNVNDTVVWKGTLIAVGNYYLVKPYFNPASYNTAVRQSDSDVPSDITTLTYFLINVDNGSDVPIVQPFAQEWIIDGSLVTIDLAGSVTLKITDPFNNPQTIVSILANAGYYSKIIS